jgi:hypothetical protein
VKRLATLILAAALVVGAVSACSSGSASAEKPPPSTAKTGWTKAQERPFLKDNGAGRRCGLVILERRFPTRLQFDIALGHASTSPEYQAALAQVRAECPGSGWSPANEQKFLSGSFVGPGEDARCDLAVYERIYRSYADFDHDIKNVASEKRFNRAEKEIGRQCTTG